MATEAKAKARGRNPVMQAVGEQGCLPVSLAFVLLGPLPGRRPPARPNPARWEEDPRGLTNPQAPPRALRQELGPRGHLDPSRLALGIPAQTSCCSKSDWRPRLTRRLCPLLILFPWLLSFCARSLTSSSAQGGSGPHRLPVSVHPSSLLATGMAPPQAPGGAPSCGKRPAGFTR